ncbi:hypothetical protein G8764_10670 [Pseudomaricurvus alcaniphilus]|nr:hypothetical protein [Pseudomaricurvus alcaniphilus]
MELSFKQFKLGAMLFFFGGVLIYIAGTTLPPSTRQEILLLAGLVIGGFGFLIAMMAQLRMLISRLLRFFIDP